MTADLLNLRPTTRTIGNPDRLRHLTHAMGAVRLLTARFTVQIRAPEPDFELATPTEGRTARHRWQQRGSNVGCSTANANDSVSLRNGKLRVRASGRRPSRQRCGQNSSTPS